MEGCQILDVVLVANDVVEEYRGANKEGLIFKVDFEKAYDHIDWRFLDFVVHRKGFGRNGGYGFKGVCLLVIFQS